LVTVLAEMIEPVELVEDAASVSDDQTSLASSSLMKALAAARDRLLDRSLRNRLISTPITSSRARQVRVFDELGDEAFAMLRSGKAMTFAASGLAASEEEGGEHTWVPTEVEEEAASGAAGRHADTKLQTKLTPESLQKRLLSLFYEGQTLEEEQGVNVLFLAIGFLEWREAKQSEIARFAPLILLPVELQRDGAKDRFKLRIRDEDLITNVSLQAWLKEQFGVELPNIPETDEWKPSEYIARVRDAIGDRKGWNVHANEIVLGFFSFAKFLLWRDLDPENWPNPDALLGSDLLKTILLRDDESAPLEDMPLVGPDDRIDQVFTPAQLVHVTDADGSQAIAIQEAMSGKNLLIQGPPGTGKSQTITNIIAGAVHAGKRVLFIAEKMAALEVVHDRLVARKLAPICLELHSRKSSKTQVLDQIKQGRNAPSPPSWPPSVFDQLIESQTSLRTHADRLHASDGNLSAFELLGRMSLLKAKGTAAPTFRFPKAAKWSANDLEMAERRAAQFGDRLALAGSPCSHPWRGVGTGAPDMLEQERLKPRVEEALTASLSLQAAVERADATLAHSGPLGMDQLPTWVVALRHIGSRPEGVDELLISGAVQKSVPEIKAAIVCGRRLAVLRGHLSSTFRSDAWGSDWVGVRRTVAGHGRSLLRMFSSDYRNAIAQLRGVWVGDLVKPHDLRLAKLDDLIDAQNLSIQLGTHADALKEVLTPLWRGEDSDWEMLETMVSWIEKARGLPGEIDILKRSSMIDRDEARRLASDLERAVNDALKAVCAVVEHVQLDEGLALDGKSVGTSPPDDLVALTRRWRDAFSDIVQWPPIRDDLDWLRSIGCPELAQQIFTGSVTASQVQPILLLAAYEAMWTELRSNDPGIENIQGDELDRAVARFRRADVDRIRVASDEVARTHVDRHPTGSSGAVGVLLDETRKSRNLKPVRRLMIEAGEAIQRFKPVFLMSPLSVAQYLKPGLIEFDLLVIDEASQVRPEDALGAIARCKQLIVVGDDKQLPPTNFFNRMVNDDGPDEDVELEEGEGRRAPVKDVESILNLCSRFPQRMLRWHYRSEHPSLIAVSNRLFYDGKLMIPPSVAVNDGKTGLLFHLTAEGHYERGKTARNEREAEDVAHAVLRHSRECPELTLGIGTFSVAQRDCIRDRLDDLARKHPELDEFMKGKAGREPVFVKNLENIQGDERDVTFISIGYGRDANGKLTQNFGPVGRDGGERRLNVLITRSRKRCEVFSSLVAEDIKLDGSGKPGVRALKAFLKLAKDGYSAYAEETQRGFDSAFEEAVAFAVRDLGYECRPQVGMAGFFIDLAVLDPRDPDRYVLGIECDGAAYHSSQYARDRDRLRQAILEKRGWKIHRIWSTDWFYRRDREIEKLRASIQAAISGVLLTTDVTEPPSSAADEPGSWDMPETTGGEPGGRTHGLATYEFADFSVRATPIKPQELSEGQLAHWVTKIVEVEQPIHSEEVGRRLAACCGWQRAGSVIQERAYAGLLAAKRKGDVVRDGDFWFVADDQDVVPRDRSGIVANEWVRKIELISPIEIAAACLHALRESLALSEDELVVETARLFGFARVGKDIDVAIRAAIKERLTLAVEPDHMGRLRLVG
jgi:very-short-patch-repair endonuclease